MSKPYTTSLLVTQAIIFMTPFIMISSATTSMDLSIAIQEMQTANYFTFVTLINMSPLDQFLQNKKINITFLMPHDRLLAQISMQDVSISDFLLRHSIPSPMLFDHLQHIPSNSTLPSSNPNFMLKIVNNGRWDYHFNNVKLISPNICTKGSSIRCHGIDGVLLASQVNITNPDLPTCFSSSSSSNGSPPSPMLPSPPIWSPGDDGSSSFMTPVAAPAPAPTPEKSESSHLWLSFGDFVAVMGSLIFTLVISM